MGLAISGTSRRTLRMWPLSLGSLHQAFEGGAGIGDLGELRLRRLEVGEKFLVFVDGLIALAGGFVELAEVVVGEDSKYGESVRHSPGVRQRAFAAQGCTKFGFGRSIVAVEQMG